MVAERSQCLFFWFDSSGFKRQIPPVLSYGTTHAIIAFRPLEWNHPVVLPECVVTAYPGLPENTS
jgi:hypothetical protein